MLECTGETNVKRFGFLTTLLLFVLLGVVAGLAEKAKSSQDDLSKQATITKEAATTTALAKVPNGIVKESELEKEHGKLVWSFDIATTNSKDITEVQVDAKNGEVISIAKESPKYEKKEQKAEHR
jgi:hypothetical protein